MIYFKKIGDLRRLEEKHIEEIISLAQNPSGNKQKKLGRLNFQTTKKNNVRVLQWN
jgi:hypothetical protein